MPERPPAAAPVAVVIEDDPDVRDLIDIVLTQAGLTTVLAGNGFEGIDAVRAHAPLLTTLDVNMPGLDGFAVARRLRELSGTHVVMISAMAEDGDAAAGLQAGADDYLVKPFRPRDLRAKADALVADAASLAARTPPGVLLPATLELNGLVLDTATGAVEVDGRPVDLGAHERTLLTTLLSTGRRVRGKADLVLSVRGDRPGPTVVDDDDRQGLDACVGALLHELEDTGDRPRFVEAVGEVGYRCAEQR
ncbi:response regulator transcription factor [Nocardioides sp. Leaf374]|uniref:response regulator transcription factor n=1 Tax=Nocardioides sp. Leaf374 TaxID=2876560 RepID=UPI001E513477|nr:response regulator transcription factor [Nocardioides sp. Leaf374]